MNKRNWKFIVFLHTITFVIQSCNNEVPDLINHSQQSIGSANQSIISLEQLNQNSSSEKWEQFFIQYNGGYLWETLQKEWKMDLTFDFRSLIKSVKDTNQQLKKLTKGIIHYLFCYQLTTQSITLNYGKEIAFTGILWYMSRLTHLQNLDLSSNQLTKIPNGLDRLVSLRGLDLSCNNITAIPNEISNLKNLHTLILYHNNLKVLPAVIGDLPYLCSLDLSFNQIEQLPLELCKLNLMVLKLQSNFLTKLPSELGNLNRLGSLFLNSNRLTEIPLQIGQLTNLWYLNLSINQLTEIPIEIGNCFNLKELNLNKNKLDRIPIEVGKLFRLKKLLISYNNLEIVPTKISKLVYLNEFDIDFNQLTKLPLSILSKLLHPELKLTLNQNPWLDINYYHKRRNMIKHLKKEELRTLIYKRAFPHSLLTLCAYYIKTHKNLLHLKELKEQLPKEFQHFKHLLRPAYQWNKNKDIVCFKMIKKPNYIPFYLDFPLITPKNVKDMLNELKEEPIFKIS